MERRRENGASPIFIWDASKVASAFSKHKHGQMAYFEISHRRTVYALLPLWFSSSAAALGKFFCVFAYFIFP